MNRIGFMSQLEGYLADIPAAEREEALQYYSDYFEDAGAENEQSVISSLGSPREIADNIKAELRGEAIPTSANPSDHAVTKYGQIVPAGEVKDEEVKKENTTNQGASGRAGGAGGAGGFGGFGGFGGAGGAGGYGSYGGEGGYGASAYASANQKTHIEGWVWIVALILLIIVLPGILTVVSGVFGIAVGLIATFFSLIVAAGAVAVALFVTAAVLSVLSLMSIGADLGVAVLLGGAGMLVGCISIVSFVLTIWLCGRATPALFKGIVYLCKQCWKGIKALFGYIINKVR